ncbi:MAG TPA: FkbM family methyltransferase [Terriglobia bacterium]|nr:FkbM family methyltransferase [Terriglobia bacterium]
MAGRHRECIRCNARAGLAYSLKLWLLTFPRRWLCTRAQSNITPTKWLATLLRLPRSRTVYHGFPVNGSSENPRSSSVSTTFAFVGRLVSTKGVQTLLQAAQQLTAAGLHYRLKIIGDGPDRQALQRQAVALGLGDSVEFLGYTAPERLEEKLAGAATIIMPSLAGEVFGMVAAENMARGKVVIVSDVGAMREVVGDAGLSFPAGNAGALTQCMKGILEEATLPARLSLEARRRAAEQFGQDKMVLQHLHVYLNGPPLGALMQSEAFKTVVRAIVPRELRNWVRSPSRSSEWLWDSARFSFGTTKRLALSNDWQLVCHPRAYKVFSQSQLNDAEQGEEFRRFVSHCCNTMLLFDIGAHFGVFSLAAAHYGGKALAIDPSPIATRMISTEAALNGCTNRIQIIQAAASDRDGEIGLLSAGVFSQGYFKVVRGRSYRELRKSPTITIDGMARAWGAPTHVKIDVEGHEAAVLRGGRATLSEYSPVLFLELHTEMIRLDGGDPEAALDELSELGYDTFGPNDTIIGRRAILEKPIIRITARRGANTRPIDSGA